MSDLSKRFAKLPSSQQALWARCVHPSGAFIEFTVEELNQSIPERFEKMVRLHPHREAVKTKLQSLTYDELNKAANRVAHYIRQRNGAEASTIALLADQDALSIAAMLGILKAGKTCSLLDATLPRQMLTAILSDCQAVAIAAHGSHVSEAVALAKCGLEVIDVDELEDRLSADNLSEPPSPDHLAFLIYTSGSTGQPKGIMVTHRSALFRALRSINAWHICAEDRISLLPSLATSFGLRTAFDALLNGASLAPFSIKQKGILALSEWLRMEEITIYTSAPTVFRSLGTTLSERIQFPKLRLIQLTAELVRKGDVDIYKKNFSRECILGILFASSETGPTTQYFIDRETTIAGDTVPLGYAADYVEMLLLDDAHQPVGSNETGDIAVRSRYLFPGYWRDTELTRAKILPDPDGGEKHIYLTGDLGRRLPDGCFEYVGRKDLQVSVRGQRVEVAQVEAALGSLENVRESVVVQKTEAGEEKRLIAYIVPAHQSAPSASALRRALKDQLPDYMVPQVFVILNEMPLTPNGKIDRRALPDPDRFRPQLETSFIAPRTSIEAKVTNIWAEVLNLNAIGIHDDFFELGGHSLLAVQIISKVHDIFGIEASIRSLLDAPTVAGLAAVVETLCASKQKAGQFPGDPASGEETGDL